MKISHSSKLMKNQKHAFLMPPDSGFKVLQTLTGNALFFSIGSNGILYCVCETPGSITGWKKIDLSGKLEANKQVVKAFDISENLITKKIDLVMVVTIEGKDNLYVSLNNIISDPSWFEKMSWQQLTYDDKNHPRTSLVINDVFIKQSSSSYIKEFILADVLRNPQDTDPIIFRYYVNPTPQQGQQIWTPHDLSSDLDINKIVTGLGRKSKESIDGIYTFGSIKGNTQLIYTPLFNIFNPSIPPSPTKLKYPANASAIAVGTRADFYTDLYIAAGGSIFLYPYDKQTKNDDPILVSTNPIFNHITALYVDISPEQTCIWGLNSIRQIFYISRKTGETDWSYPVPILTGVNQLSSYLNVAHNNSVIFANLSGKKLVQLSRDPLSSLWQQREILLPPPDTDDVSEVNTYTTHIRVTDDNNLPLPNAVINLSGTGYCSLYVNNEYCTISNDVPIEITADENGTITLFQEVNTIGAICYHIRSTNLISDINPMNAILNTMSGVKSTDDLKNIRVNDADGNSHTLVPVDTTPDKLDATVESLKQFVKMGADMPADGSVKTARPIKLKSAELYRKVLSKTDTLWGVTYDDDRWQYHDGNSLLKYLGINNGIPAGNEAWEIPGYTGSFTSIAGDIFNWIKDQFASVTRFIVNVVDNVYHCFITIAGTVFNFVIDCVNKVVQAAEFVFNKIKVFIEDLIKWLGFLFQWKDILRTKDVMKNILKLSIRNCIESLGQTKTDISDAFRNVQQRLDEWAGLENTSGSLAAGASEKSLEGQDSPEANWGNYHVQNGGGDVKVNTNIKPGDGPTLEQLLKRLSDLLVKEGHLLEQVGKTIEDEIIGQLGTLPAGEIIKRIIAVMGRILIGTIENIVVTSIEVLMILMQGIIDVLDAPIDIPVISWLYKEITGNQLSLLDASCLIIAIPSTIIYKLIKNEAPFPDNAFTRSILNAKTYKQLQAAFRPSTEALNLGTQEGTNKTLGICRVISGYGSVGLIAMSCIKKVSPEDRSVSILHGIFFFATTLPTVIYSLVEQEQTWDKVIGNGAYVTTVVQKLIDIFPAQGNWREVNRNLDFVLGIISMFPVIGGISRKQKFEDIIVFIGGTCWNANRMLTPWSTNPKVFTAKMSCIGLFGLSQLIAASVEIADH